MTKKLEELFNLDSGEQPEEETVEEVTVPVHEQVTSLDESYKAVQAITRDLPQISELDDLNDQELDTLAQKAEQAYDDLMDLGMNVEVRYSGRIFEVAASMMGNAINAKTAKIDKKLKAIDLQLKKYKIDTDSKGSAATDPNNIMNGEGYIITDRNELLKKLGQKD